MDFVAFIFIFHRRAGAARSFSASCEAVIATLYLLFGANKVVSSANVGTIVFLFVEISAVYRRYSGGQRTLPCGTPASARRECDLALSTWTSKVRLSKMKKMIERRLENIILLAQTI